MNPESASIPLHKAAQRSDFGIFVKEIASRSAGEPVGYAHRDDFYVFGLVTGGSCRVGIDFREYRLSEGDVVAVRPGQVHRVADAGDAEALLLFADAALVDPPNKQVLAEYALCPAPCRTAGAQRDELERLFKMILRRMDSLENDDSKRIVRYLSDALMGMVTEILRSAVGRLPGNRRHVEIVLAFRELLAEDGRIVRNPAHYAAALHISPVYLNEVVKNVTGESVGRYIRNEIVLRAKRMLVYTTCNIGEIACELGFDDYAYFTRLFTKQTGMNPTAYRKKYLE